MPGVRATAKKLNVSLKLISSAQLPTRFGRFKIIIFRSAPDGLEHVALVKGSVRKQMVLARVHSQCVTGDTFGSLRCDCGEQLHKSLEQIGRAPRGVLLYLNQEGRGIGLGSKIKAYALQDKGLDTVEANEALGFPADARQYRIAALILKKLGVAAIKLLTNNPDKECQLLQSGVKIIGTLPLEIKPNKINRQYLKTKKERFNHRLRLV